MFLKTFLIKSPTLLSDILTTAVNWVCGFDCEVHFTKIYMICVIDKCTDWIANKYKLLEKSQEKNAELAKICYDQIHPPWIKGLLQECALNPSLFHRQSNINLDPVGSTVRYEVMKLRTE